MAEQTLNYSLFSNDSYKAAREKLNTLQSNDDYLKLAKQSSYDGSNNLLEVEEYLLRSGVTLEKLDTLSVIHVAGTKGKGSACAYTEAILRKHGFCTGFFSSPHLVSVRERIRINGQPISELCFTKYFWKVYRKLESTKKHESDMPQYFKFLTVLMFHIFLEKDVDVAIIEVGIGGLRDSTNIVRNPVCVGITSLALDHTSLLGNTLEDIAFQKAGIFKPKAIAFSVPQHPAAMSVLEKRAAETGCSLHIVPPFKEYKWENLSPILKITNNVQQQNASLSIQLAAAWITSIDNKVSTIANNTINFKGLLDNNQSTVISTPTEQTQYSKTVSVDKIAIGLSSCKWPGRMQILRSSVADFFLDGAHTIESIECCISWFKDVTLNSRGEKVLIFNTKVTRNPYTLLKPLKSSSLFNKAYFVPSFAASGSLDDNTNKYMIDNQKHNCKRNAEMWGTNSHTRNNVFEVLQEIKQDFIGRIDHNNDEKCQILVTGSLLLVGAVLDILDPHLTMSTKF